MNYTSENLLEDAISYQMIDIAESDSYKALGDFRDALIGRGMDTEQAARASMYVHMTIGKGMYDENVGTTASIFAGMVLRVVAHVFSVTMDEVVQNVNEKNPAYVDALKVSCESVSIVLP